jgi:uncharacterized protein
MKARLFLNILLTAAIATVAVIAAQADTPKRKILFFTKSATFEHSVISWKNGQPSWAEKNLLELGQANNWEFVFSKDGSKFSKDYLAQFDCVMFYTTGNLMDVGKDGQPAMTAEGKQALMDYVKSGKGFVGSHSASDTFHTNNEAVKGPDRFRNFGDAVDPYVKVLGAEFIRHGAQQEAKNRVIDHKFPGFEKLGADYSLLEEWYSLKDFREDIHVLSVIDAPAMKGKEYERPPFPTTWARKEGEGRVFYTAMGHREDVWTNPVFRDILVGGLKWAMGDAQADITPNLKEVAPGAMQNPAYFESPPPKPAKKKPEAPATPEQPATATPDKKAA